MADDQNRSLEERAMTEMKKIDNEAFEKVSCAVFAEQCNGLIVRYSYKNVGKESLIHIEQNNERRFKMEEKKILEGELEEVSGETWHETEQLIEMIKYAGYEDFGNKLYAMNYVGRDLAIRKFLNTHGCGPYGYSLYQGRENRYSIGGKFISHEEFMKGVGKKLGLKESQVSYFL